MWLSPVGRGGTPSRSHPLAHISSTSQTLLVRLISCIYFTTPTDASQLASVVCFFTSLLNWAAWMPNCTWQVRFLITALFYCRVCSLQFHFDRGGMSTQEKTPTSAKSQHLWRSTHVAPVPPIPPPPPWGNWWGKKNNIFCSVLFSLGILGNVEKLLPLNPDTTLFWPVIWMCSTKTTKNNKLTVLEWTEPMLFKWSNPHLCF